MTQEETEIGRPPETSAVRAVMYLRVASPRPDDSQAAAHQRAACLHVAERRGLSIAREYLDLGTPGRFDRQSALQHLLSELAEKCEAETVVVSDKARLSRSLPELMTTVQRIRGCGAIVVTADNLEQIYEGRNEA
ncbi:recombinase family protein [Catenulispora acidiphila]|uniref:recombinase family protein n=1 Tax=Catenulispora acidiphila TaxID=304895 RepID=UPI0009FC1816|nr:recombinase family protein [Catenulispora acidiphila]